MSGISQDHNKFISCKNCPHRTAEPNCHTTCEGYLHRKKLATEKRKLIDQERKKNAADKVLKDSALKAMKRYR